MTTQHKALNGTITILRKAAVGFCTVALIGSITSMASAADILTGTGPEGSFSHFVGRAICRAINRSADSLACDVIPADSGTHNLTNLNGGSLDLALIDSRLLVDAMARSGRFAFLDIRYDNLGLLLPLYQLPVVLIARADSGIATLADVKGKRINAGIPRSAVREAVDFILAAKGWTKRDFKLVQELPPTLSQDTMAFCHGAFEAMFHIGVHPDSALEQLMNLCDALLLGLDDNDIARQVAAHPGYSPANIPATAYPGMPKPVATFATTIHLVASGSLDDQTTRTILEGLQANQSSLRNIHPALGQLMVARSNGPDIGVKLHPGAEAYFSMHSQ